ncbi:MAG TPA: iron-containing redox enzyme family protein [Thermoplasmata archaeon]|nr:iron-containing redox enzyme family protein [Thermoplasmata archaeon]
MAVCPVCFLRPTHDGALGLAEHLVERAAASDPGHIRWLNQNVTPHKQAAPELAQRLSGFYSTAPGGLAHWIKSRFIARFYGPRPHPFVEAMQHPTRATLLGYVVEHQHFLRQWVRSCAFIMARTDEPEAVRYEIDNLNTEFAGFGTTSPAHYELLLEMGESLGLPRTVVLATPPRSRTRTGIDGWDQICREQHWVAAMAAMHGLELIAHRGLVDEGATVHYFDPAILTSEEYPPPVRAFLREGYEADVGHADQALSIVERFAATPELTAEVQSVFLRSIDLFDDYLLARLERAEEYEAPT